MWKIKIEIETEASIQIVTEITKLRTDVTKLINSINGLTVKKLHILVE